MIYVLLPAYNEEDSLKFLLPKIKEFMAKDLKSDFHVITCNDGSNDRTQEVLGRYQKEIPLTVIHHKINRGLGETSRDLFEKAAELSKDSDIIIRMDCDDTHEPEYIRGLINKLAQGYDVVIASRFIPGGGQEGLDNYRKFISFMANRFMKIFFPIKGLKEYSSGFRAYRAGIIKKAIAIFGNNFIQLKGLGFTCTLEKIIKLRLIGARISEAPFVLRYGQKKSLSKMVGSVTTLGYMVMVLLYYWPWGGWRSRYKNIAGLEEKRDTCAA